MSKTKILFVCMGNICRSPTAEGVARAMAERAGLAERFEFDSAGTHGYHLGEAPDRRSQRAAQQRGYDLSSLRARQVEAADFARFDLILAMDEDNLAVLRRLCPPEYRHRLGLLLDFAPQLGRREVPDPYYGGPEGFQEVLDLIEAAMQGLLTQYGQINGEKPQARP